MLTNVYIDSKYFICIINWQWLNTAVFFSRTIKWNGDFNYGSCTLSWPKVYMVLMYWPNHKTLDFSLLEIDHVYKNDIDLSYYFSEKTVHMYLLITAFNQIKHSNDSKCKITGKISCKTINLLLKKFISQFIQPVNFCYQDLGTTQSVS